MPRAYWLIGPPGCGKSTWVKNHLEKLEICEWCAGTGWGHPDDPAGRCFKCNGIGGVPVEAVVISRDALVEQWAAAHHLTYSESFEQLFWSKEYAAVFSAEEFLKELDRAFFEAVDANKDIIVDMTNTKGRFRIESIPDHYTTYGIIFKISGELLAKRLRYRERTTGKYVPLSAIHDRIRNYVPPTEDEFDEVHIVEQD